MLKKVTILSDTHGHLTKDAHNVILGDYSVNQIYESYDLCIENKERYVYSLNDKDLHKKPDLIIHAGDIGCQNIVDVLESICPLKAVLGNCDFLRYKSIEGIKNSLFFDFYGVKFYVAHKPHNLDYLINNVSENSSDANNNLILNVCIHGHTHFPELKIKENSYKTKTLYICPGSALYPRYGSLRSIVNLYINNGCVHLVQFIKI